MVERGAIRNREFKNQVADMSGLRWGNITPTDLDAFLDFGDRLFVLIEGKFRGAQIREGQLKAIERLCDSAHCPPRRYSYAIIADHAAADCEDIDFANMAVRSIRQNRKWASPIQKGLTVKAAIDRMKAFADNRQKLRPV